MENVINWNFSGQYWLLKKGMAYETTRQDALHPGIVNYIRHNRHGGQHMEDNIP
ncbi:MAG: hypothetical protein JEY79_09320 [Pseudodesulfovibrio sp.]|nr:hypothetical protein [Pseudodesulfovibrio sp.]